MQLVKYIEGIEDYKVSSMPMVVINAILTGV
jgi:hypothetical protein